MKSFNNTQLATQEIISLIDSHNNVCILGAAGTGKTTLIKGLISYYENKKIVILGPTGLAISNYNDCIPAKFTLHSALGMSTNIADYSSDIPEPNKKALYNADIIIVDEIGAVNFLLFDKLMSAVTEIPFKPVIVCLGDFLQLPPVVDQNLQFLLEQKYSHAFNNEPFVFKSPNWGSYQFHYINLTEIKRQSNQKFSMYLNHFRLCENLVESIKYINQAISHDVENAIILCSKIEKMNMYNQIKIDQFKNRISYEPINQFGDTDAISANQTYDYAPGMRVLLTINSSEFTNGELGTIEICTPDSIYVNLDATGKTIEVTRYTFKRYSPYFDGEKVCSELIGSVDQFPIVYGYALTIHKAQGLTLDKVIIDPADCFSSGQIYVALSRCKNFENMKLTSPIKLTDIKISNLAKAFLTNPDNTLLLAKSLLSKDADVVPIDLADILDGIKVKEIMQKKYANYHFVLDLNFKGYQY